SGLSGWDFAGLGCGGNLPSSLMKPPSRILMFKGHSAGIGDLLRSSAAWRVLKNAYPNVELHLLLFTREPGYPSEQLIRDHHLLSSLAVIDKRTPNFPERRRFWADLNRIAKETRPDMVIDFESGGLRTSQAALWLRLRWGARTIGINTLPGRNLFYSRAATSPKKFAQKRGLPWPMEYTDRDFVALSALGLERAGCPIELEETEAGRQARLALRREHGLAESVPLLGLNIGCGTPDAVSKRPDLAMLSELMAGLQNEHGMQLVLTGAPFERAVNEEFCAIHCKKSSTPIIDLAGKTNISGLTGIIKACEMFVSSDSGPYHMGVAMRVPTLAIFSHDNRTHFHSHPWVRCCIASDAKSLPELRSAAEELLMWGTRAG
ncbi:MAG TPA: glycosyltransferase family 9 protein, partial [Verrucomicrobiae bacterium]|nr:glycosyltransferase family 9 protein [Verrucomicrobiae bacterium]